VSVLASLIIGVLAWVPFAALVWHYRRGLTSVPDDGYEREPPLRLPPAVVGTLFGARRFAVDSAATLLDLVARGVIRLDRLPLLASSSDGPLEHDHGLTLVPERADQLRGPEVWLVETVFREMDGGNPQVTLS